MKNIIYTTLLAACALLGLAACSNVDEDERLVFVKPEVQGRNILIEDFTGQNCVNCPKATNIIEQLQKEYGADTIIAVAIHCGYFGVHNSPTQLGLATDLGDTYYDHWKVESQPSGLIDRSDGLMPMDWWTAKAAYDLKEKAQVNISLDNTYHPQSNTVDISAELVGAGDATVSGKLQLWVTEDSINAFQIMPDGKRNNDYIHNHVLRAAVNGTWGDDVTVVPGQALNKTYELTLDKAWNPKHLYIVAFVYDDNGVKQVVRKKIE
ncbi:MAG: Omp28 family outer membrane lipoprotein [Prevotella sp.]|nr:Omp28 family outer membrane lipoprotein [Prevotella sp.]MDY5258798.1 Omp28 family outer membrane lipoprotein [Prevotella sp.]